jgi:VanZ family protein
MEKLRKLLNIWLPVVVWALIIFLFSNRPSISTVDFYLGDFLLKKTAHLIEYGIFSFLIYRALTSSGVEKKKAMWISVLICFLYGATDEFHQSFIAGRTPTVRDVIIDTTGATIMIYGVIKNIKKLPHKLQNIAEILLNN